MYFAMQRKHISHETPYKSQRECWQTKLLKLYDSKHNFNKWDLYIFFTHLNSNLNYLKYLNYLK